MRDPTSSGQCFSSPRSPFSSTLHSLLFTLPATLTLTRKFLQTMTNLSSPETLARAENRCHLWDSNPGSIRTLWMLWTGVMILKMMLTEHDLSLTWALGTNIKWCSLLKHIVMYIDCSCFVPLLIFSIVFLCDFCCLHFLILKIKVKNTILSLL
ncbi:hypothetical protein WDU94_004164 [Cyamophila willieti]